MTKICFESAEGRYILSAKGHATGSVEVCAAISGILYALAGYLAMTEEAEEHAHRVESADVLLDYSGPEQVAAAYDMAVTGFLLMQESFPGLLEVEISEN